MRIVAVTPLYPPKSRVGAWLATHELLADLARRGHQVDVFCRLSGATAYDLDGVRVAPGKRLDPIETAIVRADVVVSHCGDDGLVGYLAGRHQKPSVRMVHGHNSNTAQRLAGAALAVFNSLSLAAASRWNGRQIVVHPVARDVTALPGDRVTLVNISANKGGDLFWRLARALPDTGFLGVKGGWGMQSIYSRPNVRVIQTTPNMAAVYARTRVLLMPSLHETWGLVGVEAMSCGIPVIAHPTAGLRESLGEAGIFVHRNHDRGWIDELERLSEPDEWERASIRAKARVAELDPAADLARFAEAIESFERVAA